MQTLSPDSRPTESYLHCMQGLKALYSHPPTTQCGRHEESAMEKPFTNLSFAFLKADYLTTQASLQLRWLCDPVLVGKMSAGFSSRSSLLE